MRAIFCRQAAGLNTLSSVLPSTMKSAQPSSSGGDRLIQIVDDIGAFISGVVDRAHPRGSEHTQEGIVADPIAAAREIGIAIDDVLAGGQRDGVRARGADHAHGMIRREHHGLPAEQNDLAVQRPMRMLANDRFGDVRCDSHQRPRVGNPAVQRFYQTEVRESNARQVRTNPAALFAIRPTADPLCLLRVLSVPPICDIGRHPML
jgi:hypothetical protein